MRHDRPRNAMTGNKTNLVWLDLEMTGLDCDRDVILEIAAIMTDSELNIIAESPNMAISQQPEAYAHMDDWNVKHHNESGLIARVNESLISLEEAEAVVLQMVSIHVERGVSPLCGNSIWQDRRFLIKYMPTLESYFHYRNIDVSSIKELVRRWRPRLLEQVKKQHAHRALDDIRESIEELRLYRKHFFR